MRISCGPPVHYWRREELMDLLADIGFKTHHHAMVDVLPYPHVLYICQLPASR